MSAPHHRHQESLEGYIDFSTLPTLQTAERLEAKQRFYKICVYFESKGAAQVATGNGIDFNRPSLVKLTYEYSLSEVSRDGFLRVFFDVLAVPMRGDISTIDLSDPAMESSLEQKAAFGKTPQPSPATHSAVARIQGDHQFIGTPERIASLRRACLQRDRHRCVISHAYDIAEGMRRNRAANPALAVDDDGNPFPANEMYTSLEVAHIIPHALLDSKGNTSGTLDERRQSALKILNMFDYGVSYTVDGVDMDRPRNAMTLSKVMHDMFGSFTVFFTPIDGQEHTYLIDSFIPPSMTGTLGLPVTRTLYIAPDRAIDPPSPRLLAVHRAIAHILHLSGAGDYIDYIFQDVEEVAVRSDGSTPLGRLVNLGLSGLLRA